MGKRRTKAQIRAVQLVKEDPEASNYEISKKMIESGHTSRTMYLDQAVVSNKRMKADIAIIRERNAEELTREIVPVALKKLKTGLKTRELTIKERFPYVKLALDKEFGTDESKRPVQPMTINIEKIQAIILQSPTEKDKDNKELDVEVVE